MDRGAYTGSDIHNGALVAMDARSGDIVAYVGSAGYYRDDLASPQFDPKFDVAGRGYRQPGSAWKPLVYVDRLRQPHDHAWQLLMDVVTEFARGWFPRDADLKERGPVLMRDASELLAQHPDDPGTRPHRRRQRRQPRPSAGHHLRPRRQPARGRRTCGCDWHCRDEHGPAHLRVRDDRQRWRPERAAHDPRDRRLRTATQSRSLA